MKMGKKAMMAIKVAPSNGMAVCRPMAVNASIRGFPFFRSTKMPSTITMALSTNIPIAKMKAPKETRCIVPSNDCKNRKVPSTVTTKLTPMISPLLNPMVSIKMKTTIATDSIKLITKVPKESFTRSDWKNTLW